MHPIDLAWGWIFMNMHGPANDNLTPWGKAVIRPTGWGQLNQLEWFWRRLIEYAADGWDHFAWRVAEISSVSYDEWELARYGMSRLVWSSIGFSCPQIDIANLIRPNRW
ncbi:hypothetical protein AMR42_14380 [Limnothrix sp. PR1529]|uniref:hypothetical protein n=1 Tax=Limnothrix sp. PR1529 TaxID=1704291 RepID=UPI00081E6540|nr:hypothetical protein [Limnothrix sp. PR1529]OCQ94028.1 hypothetical protein BCR12_05805 [Limnothrix sp. P13C2]PIB07309.1 hypothetical protein AMR42_14380 [Limnothrix sp. PR1529]